jgi:D-ribose pyranose/furanose isomerase RbsD
MSRRISDPTQFDEHRSRGDSQYPPLVETLETFLSELEVEKIIVADETRAVCPHLFNQVEELFPGLPMDTMPLIEFKSSARRARRYALASLPLLPS